MISLNVIDFVGYLAGALVVTTFYLRTIVRMRMVAIASNVVFITYGALTGAVPILVLHVTLLPINVLRLAQIKKLIRRIVAGANGEISMALLVPFMTVKKLPAGTELFSRGDRADALYYVLDGYLKAVAHDVDLGPGSLVGEIGIFSPDHLRSDTVVCRTDVELASITDSKIWELFYQHPEFGAYLMRLVAQRAARPSVPARVVEPDSPPAA